MDFIRDWALSACIASICGGLLHMLSPSGSMERVMKISASIFFLGCLLSPIVSEWKTDGFISYYESYYDTASIESEYDEIYKEQIKHQLKENLHKIVMDRLHKLSVNPDKIEIIINIDGEGSILINQIAIYISPQFEAKKQKIESVIKKDMDVFPVIIITEESEQP